MVSVSQTALTFPFFPATAISAPQRVVLPHPDAQAQAESRMQTITPLLNYHQDADRYTRLRLQDGTPVTSFSRFVEYISETSDPHVPTSTLYRWLASFREGGMPALADRQRSDKNSSRFFKAYPRAAWLAAYWYLGDREFPGQSKKVVYEAILRNLDVLEVPPESVPSYETVRAWLNQIPAALEIYARKGQKAYRDRMAAYLQRAYNEYSNQIWVGDHMIHDVECFNDAFDNVEWGAPIRIRLSGFTDYRSRMFVGATWCWEGSSRAIAAAMRRGITKYGPPESIYVDNGKDYRKVGKGARPGYTLDSPLAPKGWWQDELKSIEATGFLARLGIGLTHCLPYHGQSKGIERVWRTTHSTFDAVWPTYVSGSPFTRSDSASVAMTVHRRLMRHGRVAESEHPRASVFVAACLAWMEEYADTPQNGKGMDGGTPRQVFEANFNPNQKPTPDRASLALLMAERKQCLVRHGAITLNKRRYVPVDQAGWSTLHEYSEREILVAYDRGIPECADALDLDGFFLATLQSEQLLRFAPGDPATQAQIAESMATRRHLEKGTREAVALISQVARANGAQTPLEAMASRLQLSAGETGEDVITQRAPRRGYTQTDQPTQSPVTPAQAAREFLEGLRK